MIDVLLNHLKIYSYAALFFGVALGCSPLSNLYISKTENSFRLTCIGLFLLASICFSWKYFIFYDSGEFIYAPMLCDAFYEYENSFPPESQPNPYNLKEFISPTGECYISGLSTIATWILLIITLSFFTTTHFYDFSKNFKKNIFTHKQNQEAVIKENQCGQTIEKSGHLSEFTTSEDFAPKNKTLSSIENKSTASPCNQFLDDKHMEIFELIAGNKSTANTKCKHDLFIYLSEPRGIIFEYKEGFFGGAKSNYGLIKWSSLRSAITQGDNISPKSTLKILYWYAEYTGIHPNEALSNFIKNYEKGNKDSDSSPFKLPGFGELYNKIK